MFDDIIDAVSNSFQHKGLHHYAQKNSLSSTPLLTTYSMLCNIAQPFCCETTVWKLLLPAEINSPNDENREPLKRENWNVKCCTIDFFRGIHLAPLSLCLMIVNSRRQSTCSRCRGQCNSSIGLDSPCTCIFYCPDPTLQFKSNKADYNTSSPYTGYVA